MPITEYARWATPRAPLGFTLIELLIVVALLGVLSATTLMAYNQFEQHEPSSKVSSQYEDAVRVIRAQYARAGSSAALGLDTSVMIPSTARRLGSDSRGGHHQRARRRPRVRRRRAIGDDRRYRRTGCGQLRRGRQQRHHRPTGIPGHARRGRDARSDRSALTRRQAYGPKGSRNTMVCSRSGPVETRSIGTPTASSMRAM